MKSKLLKLLYEYSANGKLVDGKYIQKLIEIVVDSKGIVDYAGGLIITDKDSRLRDPNSLLAVYYPNRKLIAVYLDAIEEMLKSYNTYQEMFSSTEELFYKNLLVTQVVLHELEHANQRKIMDKEESLEGDILRASLSKQDKDITIKLMQAGLTGKQIDLILETQKTTKSEGGLILPDERLAEIKSHQEIKDTLSEISDEVPNLIEFENASILESKLRGYTFDKGRIISPTIDYLISTGKSFALQKFEWFNKDSRTCLKNVQSLFSLDERLTYGLPIDNSEFMESSKTLLSTKKYSI